LCACIHSRSTASHPEQVLGSALAVKYDYDKDGKPVLISEPRLMLNDSAAGKPEGIHLMIGRRPNASFGNSTGDPACAGIYRCRGRRATVTVLVQLLTYRLEDSNLPGFSLKVPLIITLETLKNDDPTLRRIGGDMDAV